MFLQSVKGSLAIRLSACTLDNTVMHSDSQPLAICSIVYV